MAELVSAMPTAGGIYYWSFKLGKPVHGWLNVVKHPDKIEMIENETAKFENPLHLRSNCCL